jgi:hypothetical protein
MSGCIFSPIREQTMSRDSTIQIDSSHCRAICDEIGERLRMMLDREATALPPRLQVLLLRLAEQDMVASPSIAAAIDDMVWQPKPAGNLPGSVRAA